MFAATGIGCAVMLVSAGLTWLHYYILLIPLVLFMIRPLSEHDQQSLPLKVLRISPIVVLLIFTQVFMRGTDPIHLCIAINAATLALIGLAFCDIWFQRIIASRGSVSS